MFFLDVFLSAARFPSLTLAVQPLQGLPLCSLLLSAGQAGGCDETIGKGSSMPGSLSHIASPYPYRVPTLGCPNQCFFLISAPVLEALSHPNLKSSKDSCSSLLLAPGEEDGLLVRQYGNSGLGVPSLHPGQISLAKPFANVVAL